MLNNGRLSSKYSSLRRSFVLFFNTMATATKTSFQIKELTDNDKTDAGGEDADVTT